MAKGRFLLKAISHSRKVNARHSIPILLRWAVIKKRGAVCFYCGLVGKTKILYDKPVVVELQKVKKWINEYDETYTEQYRSMEFHHIIPIVNGGKNVLENLEICCRKCNRQKGDRI